MNNKEIIKQFCKALWEDRDLGIIDKTFSENAVMHSPFNAYYGSVTMHDIANKWLTAFPDLKISWEDFIWEGDKVVCRWRATGTHMGSFFDTSPTHKEVTYTGVGTFQLEDGKVIQYWGLVDMHAILRQLEVYESIAEVVE